MDIDEHPEDVCLRQQRLVGFSADNEMAGRPHRSKIREIGGNLQGVSQEGWLAIFDACFARY
jgi:hypothetical protein